MGWHWPKQNLGGGVDGSAMSKLFRGGLLSDTALLARESIQNSTDAAERFLRIHPDVSSKIIFRFESLFGEEKSKFVEKLDLHTMREKQLVYGESHKELLSNQSVLEFLDDEDVPLNLLFVEDYGTHGLSGDPRTGKKSHLFMAMYYIGSSGKAADEGGMYGFGKSALQRASKTRSVIAHTVFEPTEEDQTFSRLIGFTWWPDIQDGDDLMAGRGSLSKRSTDKYRLENHPLPFEDDESMELAQSLGFSFRDRDQLEDFGTSFLILDPAIDPHELSAEVEKWWWPALEDHALDVEIIQPSGESIFPRPASNSFVSQFLKPYRIATGIDEPGDPKSERLASKDWRKLRKSEIGAVGELGLVSIEDPIEEDGTVGESGSYIALMRAPRMVIQYMAASRSKAPLRGAFVASKEANQLLRDTEPSTHDRWATNESSDVRADATKTAKAVTDRINRAVREMVKDVSPPTSTSQRSLKEFARIMKGFIGNSPGSKGAEIVVEPFELQFPDGRPEAISDGEGDIRIKSKFSVALADTAPGSSCKVLVKCSLFVHEDESITGERLGVDFWPVDRDCIEAEQTIEGWEMVLEKESSVVFEVVSERYPNLWTVSLQPAVTRIDDWVGAE